MRMAIILGAVLIGKAIRPNYFENEKIEWYYLLLITANSIMDLYKLLIM